MSEPDISTLARRLAEQNNVDWRSLSGSGPEGKVVERDVLDYLARVMAGSEALDPTPEPLPEGMEAWPDQDLAGFRQGVAGSAGGLAALRDEIGATALASTSDETEEDDGIETVAFGRSSTAVEVARAEASAPAVDAPAEDLLGEDIFLFDDDEEVPAAAEPYTAPAPMSAPVSAGDLGDELDDLLVAGDDDADQGLLSGAADGHADQPHATDLAGDASEEFGSDFAVGPGAGAAHAGDFGPTGDADLGGLAEFGEFGGGELGTASDAGELPDLFADPGADSPSDAEDEAALFVAGGPDQGLSAPDVFTTGDVDAEPAAAAYDAGLASEDYAPPTERPDEFDSFTVASTEGLAEEPDHVVAAPVEPAGASEGEAPSEDEALGALEARDLAVPSEVTVGALPLARPANLLRRNIDLSSLAAAQIAVGLELGDSEPLSVAPFLLRAVAKAAFDTGLTSGPVALAEFGDELRLRRLDDAASRSFAELVSHLEQEFRVEDEPALVVADLGPFDLDEVILDLDVPVVSLGRVLYDTHRGGYRSTLAVAGDVPPERGARFLARVAELLDAPVRLVL